MKAAPLYIHEDLVARRFKTDPSSGEKLEDDALTALHDAATKARIAVSDIKITHAKITQNLMQAPLRNEQQSREAAWKRVTATTMVMDAALDRARRAIVELQTAMALPKAKDAMVAIAYSDIRRGLAALRARERRAAVQRAVESGDTDIIAAISAITPIASGIDRSEMEIMVSNWNRTHHPEKLDRIERLEKASADVYKMGEGLLSWANGLTDGDAIKRAEASERVAKLS